MLISLFVCTDLALSQPPLNAVLITHVNKPSPTASRKRKRVHLASSVGWKTPTNRRSQNQPMLDNLRHCPPPWTLQEGKAFRSLSQTAVNQSTSTFTKYGWASTMQSHTMRRHLARPRTTTVIVMMRRKRVVKFLRWQRTTRHARLEHRSRQLAEWGL